MPVYHCLHFGRWWRHVWSLSQGDFRSRGLMSHSRALFWLDFLLLLLHVGVICATPFCLYRKPPAIVFPLCVVFHVSTEALWCVLSVRGGGRSYGDHFDWKEGRQRACFYWKTGESLSKVCRDYHNVPLSPALSLSLIQSFNTFHFFKLRIFNARGIVVMFNGRRRSSSMAHREKKKKTTEKKGKKGKKGTVPLDARGAIYI